LFKRRAVIGNLEGTVTNFESVSRDASYQAPESFRFTFDIKGVQALKDIGLSIVSLANNHIRDFGDEGIRQTIENTNKLGLHTFGDLRKNISQRFLIQKIGDTTFAFIPYNQFFGTKEQTFEDLKNTQSISDIQIIFAHWGDEYVAVRADIRSLAKSFVDNGADLIIGAHPHIIQEYEIYEGVPIYYSLGNFIFDQYFQEDVQKGMGVNVLFENKKISTTTEIYFKNTRHKGTCMEKPPVP
jgi:poly-gamma-glutamate synthesis protein (capsule biosynthesis protein)